MQRTKTVTLATIAEELNVSTSTVSRALAGKPGKNSDRIKKFARELGFTPNQTARSLRKASSDTIGVLITTEISSGWYSQLVCKMEEELSSRSKTMQLSISRQSLEKEKKCLDAFRGARVDGIVVGPVFRSQDLINISQFAHNSGIPIVCFACMDDLPVNYVTVDYCEGAKKAVKYLYDKGHRDIIYLGCATGDVKIISGTRLQGFNQAMYELNLPMSNDRIIVSDINRQTGWQTVKKFLADKRPLPTAFFCHNDEVAFGAMLALQQAGIRVPEDISIIGFDNLSECDLSLPPLTTVDGRMDDLSKEIVNIILNEDLKSGKLVTKVIEPTLVERASVRAI